jgi:hypothetical protein
MPQMELTNRSWCNNRLIVIGPAKGIQQFDGRVSLKSKLRARFIEILELSDSRQAWEFETDDPPILALNRLSERWHFLTFLLDYEVEAKRVKGLVKAKAGKLTRYRITY